MLYLNSVFVSFFMLLLSFFKSVENIEIFGEDYKKDDEDRYNNIEYEDKDKKVVYIDPFDERDRIKIIIVIVFISSIPILNIITAFKISYRVFNKIIIENKK